MVDYLMMMNRLVRESESMSKYIVRRVNADGSFSKKRPTQFDFCRTLEAAIARKEMLGKMNPHKHYEIDEV